MIAFSGFPPDAFTWFDGLADDNSRAYFTAHRGTYDAAVRGPLEDMLEQFADELGGQVKVFRPNRDVRFSHDKSPYKTTAYGVISNRPASAAPLYLQLSAAGLFAGTGYYRLAADQLARLRAAIVDDTTGPALEQAIATATRAEVEIFGEALKTAPRGYPRDHPRVGLLRHKAMFGGRRLDAGARGIASGRALDHARGTWDACGPLNAWLDAHVAASELPEPTRLRRAR